MRKKTILYGQIIALNMIFACFPVISGWNGMVPALHALEESLSFRLAGEDDAGTYVMDLNSGTRKTESLVREHRGLKLVKGLKGAPELQLDDAQYDVSKDTEFLLHFNDPRESVGSFEEPRYRMAGGYRPEIGAVSRFGGGAAVFSGDKNGLGVLALDGSLFEPDTFWNDFTLEFWMYTGLTGEAEEIFGWEGYTRQSGKDVPQYISVYLSDRKLNWEFGNFFISLDPDEGGLQSRKIKLTGKRSLMSHVWQHHMLRFDSRRGLLEYLIDGKTETLVYATKSQRQESGMYQAYTGERSTRDIHIGRRFRGILDEMRFSRSWVESPQLEAHYVKPGWLVMNPVNFREIGVGSKILSFDCDYRTPGTSELVFYYKMANQAGMIQPDDPSWIRFKPGVPVTENNQGQYLYIKVEFLPDGNGMNSPSFQGLRVRYKPDPPPPPPGGLVAIPGDGFITLRWNPVPGTDIRGYLLYYGTRPDTYQGEEALFMNKQAPSPVNVGNVHEIRLEGLQNGKIYYFRIATYDMSTHPDFGMHVQRSFSKEVSARPAR